MIEVCATILPQLSIPRIMTHPAYKSYRADENAKIGKRSELLTELLEGIPGIKFNPTQGAFYNTIVFDESYLDSRQFLEISDLRVKTLLEGWLLEEDMPMDKRFVYYLLASANICVVPISSFCSDLRGFRVTLLEEDEKCFRETFKKLGDAIRYYLNSSKDKKVVYEGVSH